jgi:hypothetical protein
MFNPPNEIQLLRFYRLMAHAETRDLAHLKLMTD